MSENEEILEEVTQPKKRGRKPGSSVNKNYFGPEEEQAFQNYLLASTQGERDQIFNDKLKFPFTKMIESIIRRYNLFIPYEDFSDTFNDTLSFLATKASNFKPGKGKKAYSYCGTICKNYLINKRHTTMKRDNKFLSYETQTENTLDSKLNNSGDEKKINSEFMTGVINDIVNTIDEGFWLDGSRLSNSDIKTGRAIVEILKNWDGVLNIGETQKFNKTSILYFIKENTLLSSKEIRDALKKYRMEYMTMKEKYLNEF